MIARDRRHAITLFQVMVVTAIVAVLAIAVVPQLVDSAASAKDETLRYHLQTMRSKIELYKRQHSGHLPDGSGNLKQLTAATNAQGASTAAGLSDNAHPFGPYVQGGELPVNPLTACNTVKVDNGATGTAPAPSTGAGGGWIYRPATGEIWADSAAYIGW